MSDIAGRTIAAMQLKKKLKQQGAVL
jgi:hypothetical protein